jgi:hypothetical protein
MIAVQTALPLIRPDEIPANAGLFKKISAPGRSPLHPAPAYGTDPAAENCMHDRAYNQEHTS